MNERQRLLQKEFRREQNREYNRQRNQALIKAGLCIQCKSPLDGNPKLRCMFCHEKRRIYLQQWLESHKERYQDNRRKWLQKKRQEGRCATCKNMLDNLSRSQCSRCLARRRWLHQEYRGVKPRYSDGRGHCDNLPPFQRVYPECEGLRELCGKLRGKSTSKLFCSACAKRRSRMSNRK